MQDQIMSAAFNKVFGGNQPQTIVNVGSMSADDDIFAQDEALEREIDNQLAMMGDPSKRHDPQITPSFGSISEHDLGDVSGLPAGNIVTDLLNRGRRATSGVINTMTGKTEEAFKKVNQELTAIKSTLSQTRRISQSNQRRLAIVSKKWDERFGEKTRVQRIALQTLVSLPGIRSLNILTTAQSVGVADALAKLGTTAKDKYSADREDVELGVVPAVPAGDAYTTAGMDEVRDALVASDQAIVARIAELEARLDAVLKACVDAKLDEHGPGYKALLHKDLFAQIAVISPSQLADRDEALYEGVAKYVLGAAKPAGAGILGGLI